MKSRLVVNILAHDGIISIYTGVGRVVLDSIRVLSKHSEIGGKKLVVNAFTGKYNACCLGFNKRVKNEIILLLRKNGGRVYELNNGSDGSISYGSRKNWEKVSQLAAKTLEKIYNEDDLIINLCVDTPFAGVTIFYAKDKIINQTNSYFIWVPHSTVKIHKLDSALKDDLGDYESDRFDWEQRAVLAANKFQNIFVGAIGKFMRKHLIGQYKLKKTKLVEITNGLNVEDPRYHKTYNQQDLEKLLKSYGISTSKYLILSFGRLEPYKGFDRTLRFGSQLTRVADTVLLAQPYSKEDVILGEYKKRVSDIGQKNIHFIFDYPFDLPHKILNWHKTRVLLVPSTAEPFGLIPEEFRLYNLQNTCLVVAKNQGFVEQVTDGVDGYIVNLDDEAKALATLNKALNTGADELKKMNLAGRKRVLKDYNLENNLKIFLEKFVAQNDK